MASLYAVAESNQSSTCYRVEGRGLDACLTKGQHRFDPDHHRHLSQQSQSSSSNPFTTPPTNSSSFSSNMQHFTDDLYPLEPLYQQPQQQQQQQQQQQHFYPQQQQQWAEYSPVQRQVPSTRGYSYQPYPSSSPRVAHYSASASPWDYALLDYPSLSYDSLGSSLAPSLCTDSHSFASHGLYTAQYPYSANYGLQISQPQLQISQQQQQQQQPTCIAPEDLFARMPMPLTPISPASLEDSDDRASSSSSADTLSNRESPLSASSSPTRPGLQIPTVPSLSIAPSWISASTSNASSSLPSPVDSLSSSSSSHDDHEPAFVPTPSLKKSAIAANNSLKAKRATRSAAPEPAWVEAVLAEDAKRFQGDVNALANNAGAARPANRPIAFACVFCRHRKIQCIRPKTEVAPGEKPSPCNQCEKRNRCCEYPPAALNPRIGRRTRPAGALKNED